MAAIAINVAPPALMKSRRLIAQPKALDAPLDNISTLAIA
jgi:hypothetical protein